MWEEKLVQTLNSTLWIFFRHLVTVFLLNSSDFVTWNGIHTQWWAFSKSTGPPLILFRLKKGAWLSGDNISGQCVCSKDGSDVFNCSWSFVLNRRFRRNTHRYVYTNHQTIIITLWDGIWIHTVLEDVQDVKRIVCLPIPMSALTLGWSETCYLGRCWATDNVSEFRRFHYITLHGLFTLCQSVTRLYSKSVKLMV